MQKWLGKKIVIPYLPCSTLHIAFFQLIVWLVHLRCQNGVNQSINWVCMEKRITSWSGPRLKTSDPIKNSHLVSVIYRGNIHPFVTLTQAEQPLFSPQAVVTEEVVRGCGILAIELMLCSCFSIHFLGYFSHSLVCLQTFSLNSLGFSCQYYNGGFKGKGRDEKGRQGR